MPGGAARARYPEVVESEPARGLCETCRHCRRIVSDRSSIFYLCRLHFSDARFPKYPRLPVLACAGYQRNDKESPDSVSPK